MAVASMAAAAAQRIDRRNTERKGLTAGKAARRDGIREVILVDVKRDRLFEPVIRRFVCVEDRFAVGSGQRSGSPVTNRLAFGAAKRIEEFAHGPVRTSHHRRPVPAWLCRVHTPRLSPPHIAGRRCDSMSMAAPAQAAIAATGRERRSKIIMFAVRSSQFARSRFAVRTG